MPVSLWLGLEDCIRIVTERKPRAILDVGIGFGLLGHLLRQYLDVWEGRIERTQWRVRLDGIELDAKRVQPHAQHLYSHVTIGDMRELVPRLASEQAYDIIIFGDVLEHVPKPDGLALLKTATALASALVMVRIPLGDGWRRKGREPPDDHRAQWYPQDFSGFIGTIRQYDYFGNPYALVAIEAQESRSFTLNRAQSKLTDIERWALAREDQA